MGAFFRRVWYFMRELLPSASGRKRYRVFGDLRPDKAGSYNGYRTVVVRRFIKKQVLYSTHYENFEQFKKNMDTCIADIGPSFKSNMQNIMIMKFQLFFEKTENLTV